MTAFSRVRTNSKMAVLHSAIASDTTPAATRMICMNVRYSARNRCHSGFGFSSGSAFGPWLASSCAAWAADSPAAGSTPNAAATSSDERADHRSTPPLSPPPAWLPLACVCLACVCLACVCRAMSSLRSGSG